MLMPGTSALWGRACVEANAMATHFEDYVTFPVNSRRRVK